MSSDAAAGARKGMGVKKDNDGRAPSVSSLRFFLRPLAVIIVIKMFFDFRALTQVMRGDNDDYVRQFIFQMSSGKYMTENEDSKTSILNHKQAPVKFLFLAGLEATGHELSNALLYNKSSSRRPGGGDGGFSPIVNRLENMDLLKTMEILETTLTKDIWFAHCNKADKSKVQYGYNMTIVNLQKINARFEQERQMSLNQNKQFVPGTIFLGSTMQKLSYPFGFETGRHRDECRPLKYTNLEIFDRACQDAKVACEIVLLHRDPYAIVKSSLRRKISNDPLSLMHTYISMNAILESQLNIFSKRTRACINFFEENNQTNRGNADPTLPLGLALGFETREQWEAYRTSIVHSRPPLTEEEKQAVLPDRKNMQVHMDSLVRTNDKVVKQCHRQQQYYLKA